MTASPARPPTLLPDEAEDGASGGRGSSRDSFVFWSPTWDDARIFIPCISWEQRFGAAHGGIRSHMAATSGSAKPLARQGRPVHDPLVHPGADCHLVLADAVCGDGQLRWRRWSIRRGKRLAGFLLTDCRTGSPTASETRKRRGTSCRRSTHGSGERRRPAEAAQVTRAAGRQTASRGSRCSHTARPGRRAPLPATPPPRPGPATPPAWPCPPTWRRPRTSAARSR